MALTIKSILLASWPHSVECLVLGHFKREYGTHADYGFMAWLTQAAFDSSPIVSKQEVDEKLDEWEMLAPGRARAQGGS